MAFPMQFICELISALGALLEHPIIYFLFFKFISIKTPYLFERFVLINFDGISSLT